jgi:hypothetical protein
MAESYGKRQADVPNKVLEEEQINTTKFNAAYAAFEQQPPPSPKEIESPRRTSNHGRPNKSRSLVSPRKAPRNYIVSDEAIQKNVQVVNASNDNQSVTTSESLQQVIAQLRKVQNADASKSKKDKLDQAHELLEMIRKLRKVQNESKDNSNNGDDEEFKYLLSKLRSTGISLDEDDASSVVDDAEKLLESVESMAAEDHEYVDRCLARLKKANLTEREASAVAETVQQLKFVDLDDAEAEAETDLLISNLRKSTVLYPARKVNEVTQALMGLRRVGMNNQERKILADKIKAFGNHKLEFMDKLTDAILRLKKVQLNQWEAEQMANISLDLRKTMTNLMNGGEDDDEEDSGSKNNDDDDNESYNRLTRRELRKFVDDVKMDVIDDVMKSIQNVLTKLGDRDADDFSKAITYLGEGDATKEQADHRDYMQVLVDAIRDLKKAKLNQFEAMKVQGIFVNLSRAHNEDRVFESDRREMIKLRKVTSPEKMAVIEEAVKKVKRVRFNLNDDVFEFFLDDVIATGKGEPTKEQKEQMELEGLVDVALLAAAAPAEEKAGEDDNDEEEVANGEKRVLFSRKHHWKSKNYHNTIVSEKRWRKAEEFDTDEVIFSPLSQQSHDRRKVVGEALKNSLHNNDGTGLVYTESLPAPDDDDDDEVEEFHVETVERRLRENNLDVHTVTASPIRRKRVSSPRAGGRRRSASATGRRRRSRSTSVARKQPELPVL